MAIYSLCVTHRNKNGVNFLEKIRLSPVFSFSDCITPTTILGCLPPEKSSAKLQGDKSHDSVYCPGERRTVAKHVEEKRELTMLYCVLGSAILCIVGAHLRCSHHKHSKMVIL